MLNILKDQTRETNLVICLISTIFHSLGNANGRLQQLKVMRRDFESLPKPTMAKVLEKYAMDFQLFGYSTTLPTT